MSCCFPKCPTETIIDPPIRIVRHVCHPQLIRVIHPIEIVTKHHCVPVFQHVRVCKEIEEEVCEVNKLGTPFIPNKKKGKKGRISRTKSRKSK